VEVSFLLCAEPTQAPPPHPPLRARYAVRAATTEETIRCWENIFFSARKSLHSLPLRLSNPVSSLIVLEEEVVELLVVSCVLNGGHVFAVGVPVDVVGQV
jgi:hypothetical protein